MKRMIARIWIIVCSCVVIFGTFQVHWGNPTEAIGSYYLILALTFPFGYGAMNLTYFILMYLYKSGLAPLDFLGRDLLNYATMIGAGYLQWFILVPWLVSRVKKGMANSESSLTERKDRS